MESRLKSYDDKIPIVDLQNRIKQLKIDNDDSKNRINSIKSSNVPIISKEDKNRVINRLS